jgi:hypothetical protein
VVAAELFFAFESISGAQKSQNSLQNSILAGNSFGDGRDQHCIASQAVCVLENIIGSILESPLMAEVRRRLRSPIAQPAETLSEISQESPANPKKLRFSGGAFWRPGSISTARR